MGTVSIAGLSKVAVLRALYRGARVQGLGVFHEMPGDLSEHSAKALIKQDPRMSFDYVNGRVIKCDIGSDDVLVALYDRDNGEGSAERALAQARMGGDFYLGDEG